MIGNRPRATSRAIFGGALEGSAALRYVYGDEAGTSAKEPISLFAGVVVDADADWLIVSQRIRQIVAEMVPASLREGFVFHAKTIWGDKSLRTDWDFTDRLEFMKAVMGIPREFGIPISLGMCRRGSSWVGVKPEMKHIADEMIAFYWFADRVDYFLREFAGSHEVATLVMEDNPASRSRLQRAAKGLRERPIVLTPDMQISTELERELGVIPTTRVIQITKIVDTIHFVPKGDGPILQIADAAAFALRRYFADQTYGETFAEALLGHLPNKADFSGPSSGRLFRWARHA